MKYKIIDTFPNDFFVSKKSPFISIYQETSRLSTNNKKDSLTFKNLIKEVETSLIKKYSKDAIKPIMTLLYQIENDNEFWTHSLDGLALFATLDECVIYKLKKPMKSLAVVADSFHIKPLIQYFQFAKTYQILDLDAKSFKLLQGSPYDLEEIKLPEGIENNKKDILGTDYTEPYLTSGTYAGASKEGTFHGHGGRKDQVQLDTERFFRQVDIIVDENISKKSKLPLILLSPSEHHSAFLELSNNNYLMDFAIDGTYETLGREKIKKQLELFTKNNFQKKLKVLLDKYHNLKSDEKSSDQLIEIISAAVDGRVETLFIEEDKIISGKIDSIKKQIITENLDNPRIDDIFDDLAQFTLDKSGSVFILKKDYMPTKSGVAAIYRY